MFYFGGFCTLRRKHPLLIYFMRYYRKHICKWRSHVACAHHVRYMYVNGVCCTLRNYRQSREFEIHRPCALLICFLRYCMQQSPCCMRASCSLCRWWMLHFVTLRTTSRVTESQPVRTSNLCHVILCLTNS